MSPEFVMAFDAMTVQRMQALITASATFSRYYFIGMQQVTQVVKSKTGEKAYAPVVTGTLRRGLRGFAQSPYIGVVGVIKNVPYARRREYTFDGQTDSLGRHYTMDPLPDTIGTEGLKRDHIMYIHRAITDTKPLITSIFHASAQMAIYEMVR